MTQKNKNKKIESTPVIKKECFKDNTFCKIEDKNAFVKSSRSRNKKLICQWLGFHKSNRYKSILVKSTMKEAYKTYMELIKKCKVGLHTQTYEKNTDSNIVICTPQIFYEKYSYYPNYRIAIENIEDISSDAIHYIIKGISKIHNKSKILVTSSVASNSNEMSDFISKISNRKIMCIYEDASSDKILKLDVQPDYRNLLESLSFIEVGNRVGVYVDKEMVKDEMERIMNLSMTKSFATPISKYISELRDFADSVVIYTKSRLSNIAMEDLIKQCNFFIQTVKACYFEQFSLNMNAVLVEKILYENTSTEDVKNIIVSNKNNLEKYLQMKYYFRQLPVNLQDKIEANSLLNNRQRMRDINCEMSKINEMR